MTNPRGARGERDSFVDVGAAMRVALAKANEAGMTSREHRVLAAVVALVSSWSRLTDGLYVDAIAEHAHLDYRNTRRALKRLAERGIIVYVTELGRGKVPLVGLPAAETRAPVDPVSVERNRAPVDPVFEKISSGGSDKTGPIPTVKLGTRRPCTREDREEVKVKVKYVRDVVAVDLAEEEVVDEVEIVYDGEVVEAIDALCDVTRSDRTLHASELKAALEQIERMWHDEGGVPSSLEPEIRRRAEHLRSSWSKGFDVTPKSLAKHWRRAGTQLALTAAEHEDISRVIESMFGPGSAGDGT